MTEHSTTKITAAGASARFLELLRCPTCEGELEQQVSEPSLLCLGCSAVFPVRCGIPLLSAEAQVWLKRWSTGLGQFVDEMNASTKQLLVELSELNLSHRSKSRVLQVIEGLGRHRDEVVDLFARAGVVPLHHSPAARTAPAYSPETYFTLLHRDYGWEPEVDEVSSAWTRLQNILPKNFDRGNTVVLGTGTGRLAWQMAAKMESDAPVIAIDINPLPLIVTSLLMQEESIELSELPAHPRRSSAAALTRTLTSFDPPTQKLNLLLADGLQPPLARGVFDTVITPWFVDQVPEDAAQIPALVSSLLKVGGSYICTGPFLYDPERTKPALRYCADEFVDMLKSQGFVVTAASYEPEPYLASPVSTQGRTEHVLYLHARKVGSPANLKDEPTFLKPGAGATLPVPRPAGIDQAHFALDAVRQVALLIDGRRSVVEITDRMVQSGTIADDGTAETAVRACLKLIFRPQA